MDSDWDEVVVGESWPTGTTLRVQIINSYDVNGDGDIGEHLVEHLFNLIVSGVYCKIFCHLAADWL